MLAKLPKALMMILIAILVISLSIIATLFAANYMRDNNMTLSNMFSLKTFSSNKTTKKKNYDLFAGHSFCEDAIRGKVEGKIISLTSDDRAAKINTYANTNILTFKANIARVNERFLSEQHSTREYDIKCSTSINTNTVVNLSILPVGDH